MRRSRVLFALALVVSSIGLMASPARAASTLWVNDDVAVGTNTSCTDPGYNTIQAAVDAAAVSGDTVQVCAGTYTETVTVNKSITLLGNQAGVNPNDSNWADTRTNAANESTVHGAVNLGLKNDITVDGFTVERTEANEGHFLIGSGNPQGVATSSTFLIQNTRIVGTRNTASPGSPWAGIHTNFLNDNTLPGGNFTAHQNRISIQGTASGSGILVNANLPGTDNMGRAIITDSYAANNAGNGFNVNRPGLFATVTGNRMIDDDIFLFRVGMPSSPVSSISDNLSTGVVNHSGAIRVTGGSNHLDINGNTAQSGTRGIFVQAGFTVDVNDDIEAHLNNFESNSLAGLEVQTGRHPAPFDATCNWWNDASGPTTPSNPPGTGDALVDPDGVVDYTPWLTAQAPGGPCNGPLPPTQMERKEDVRDSLTVKQGLANASDAKRIAKAIESLNQSLAPELWAGDGIHLDPKRGKKVFEEEKKAVDELMKVKNTNVMPEILEITDIDHDLAETEYNEAPPGKDKNKAAEYLAKGDADAAAGKYDKAVENYKHAWEHAVKAQS